MFQSVGPKQFNITIFLLLDESSLRLAVKTVVACEARAFSRGVITLPAPSANVRLVVGRLHLLDVGAVCAVCVANGVVDCVDGGEREAVDLGGTTVPAWPPFHLQ